MLVYVNDFDLRKFARVTRILIDNNLDEPDSIPFESHIKCFFPECLEWDVANHLKARGIDFSY